MPYTHIIFVGHHQEKLLESIRALHRYPAQKIILVVGESVTSGEDKARRIAKAISNELKPIWDVVEERVDKKNVLNATNQLLDLILQEKQAGSDVLVNASGSLRTFAIAAYVVCCCTRSPMITSIPRYDELDNEVGIEEIIELPLIPINFPTEEQKKILQGITIKATSFKNLIRRLDSAGAQDQSVFQKERSRISHHLSNMEEMMLIKKQKKGKEVQISLTFLGQIMTKIITIDDNHTS